MEIQKDEIGAALRMKNMEKCQKVPADQCINNNFTKEDTRKSLVRDLIPRPAEKQGTDNVATINESAKRGTFGTVVTEPCGLDYSEALRRQYLRAQDPELRQLVTKLQAVYVCRLQRHQILDNQYRRLQEKVQEAQAIRMHQSTLLTQQQEDLCLEKEKSSRRNKYYQELQEQMEDKQRDRLKQYQETLAEKTRVDDITKSIAEKDIRELKQKRELQAKVHTEMMTSQRARAARENQQKLACIVEATNIEQQIQEMTDRDLNIKAEKERKMQGKEELTEKIGSTLLKDERERNERAEVIRQLIEREYIERSLDHDMLEREREEREKRETLQEMNQQLEYRRRLVEEKKNKKIKDSKVPSNEESERLIESAKRDSQRQYGDDLLRQIEDNRLRREREREDGNGAVC